MWWTTASGAADTNTGTQEKPAVPVQLGGSHCEVLDNYVHHMMVGVTAAESPYPPR